MFDNILITGYGFLEHFCLVWVLQITPNMCKLMADLKVSVVLSYLKYILWTSYQNWKIKELCNVWPYKNSLVCEYKIYKTHGTMDYRKVAWWIFRKLDKYWKLKAICLKGSLSCEMHKNLVPWHPIFVHLSDTVFGFALKAVLCNLLYRITQYWWEGQLKIHELIGKGAKIMIYW